MKTPMPLLLILLTTAGCASHSPLPAIDRPLAKSGLVGDPAKLSQIENSLTDKDIARLLDADIRAKLPTALAVAKMQSHCSGYQPYLANITAEELIAWRKTTESIPQITGVVPVTPMTTQSEGTNMYHLREAAAKTGCELLLIYMQTDGSVDNYNDAAVLYWSILGLWIVPGNELERRTVMQAILVDCRTGTILGTATGDCHRKRSYPAAFKEQRAAELDREVPAGAFADLQKGVGQVVAQVTARGVSKVAQASMDRQKP